ncbi:ribonuclease P protein component [Pelagirhabdus alkalitolerans]|uniref:Ribonuclease P protein component n=1 Tax=Pelagirhabdus alkalitolerans TaxID=1612202 RepID=A0A1G6LAT6_9BACI|nr:ribonuclease P protein component [Pelagirhabdus alkalitolerans]SDC40321.1 ribonuclease P protein component [Pelagirhabdus alkalitolerans]
MRKSYRLKKDDEFQRVFKKGKSFANRQLVLYYLPCEDQTHFRFGLSVSKRVGNAVVRNRIKRYIRQAFLELEPDVKPSYDFIVIARMPTKDMDFHQVKKSLTHLLYKSNLLQSKNRQNRK